MNKYYLSQKEDKTNNKIFIFPLMGANKTNKSQLCIPLNGDFKEIKFSPEEEIELKVTRKNGQNFLIITRS